jgi:hypothetical protein
MLKKTKQRISEIHPHIEKLMFDFKDLRFSTPYEIAKYRARRLKCETIVDMGCGLGFQSFAFANECKKVIAVDISRKRIDNAKTNAEALGIKNIIFLHGDALNKDIAKKIKEYKPDIVFCDPERLEEEEERRFETISPNIDKFVGLYSKITADIAVELPPFIHDFKFDCEKEYLYYNGRKHLTVYLGSLKKNERNAFLLPENEAIVFDGKISNEEREQILKRSPAEYYIYEIKEIVNMAGLIPELIKKFPELKVMKQNNHTFLTSKKRMTSVFFKNVYNVLEIMENKFDFIIDALKRHHAKHVVLRFSVPPEQYWGIRKKYEDELYGKEKLQLFLFDDKAVICRLIQESPES